jgi:hypothetical protein
VQQLDIEEPVLCRHHNLAKIEHEPKLNSTTSWTPNPWTASLHPAVLNQVSGSDCLEKSSTLILPTSQFQSCPCKSADPKGEQHTPHATPLPTS